MKNGIGLDKIPFSCFTTTSKGWSLSFSSLELGTYKLWKFFSNKHSWIWKIIDFDTRCKCMIKLQNLDVYCREIRKMISQHYLQLKWGILLNDLAVDNYYKNHLVTLFGNVLKTKISCSFPWIIIKKVNDAVIFDTILFIFCEILDGDLKHPPPIPKSGFFLISF